MKKLTRVVTLMAGMGLAPLAAHAEPAPMTDAELQAVSGQGVYFQMLLTGVDGATDNLAGILENWADQAQYMRVGNAFGGAAAILDTIGECNIRRLCAPM